MKSSLKVSPLKFYPKPGYPSSFDKNPLDQSSTDVKNKNGFYFSAILGAIGLFSFSTASNKTSLKDNPIKFDELGLPHSYAMFGTGLPDRLRTETAISIIDSVFSSNGINLKSGYNLKNNNLCFDVTKYDKNKNIGYVWLNHKALADDCFVSWKGQLNKNDLLPEHTKEYQSIEKLKNKQDRNKYFEKLAELESRLLNNYGYYRLLKIRNHLHWDDNMLKKIEDYITKNQEFLDPDYGLELIEEYNDKVLDLEELKVLTNQQPITIASFSNYSSILEYYDRYMLGLEDENLESDDPREKAIQNLETLVQEYIYWAKSEGRI